jgi:hypothetical protein
MRLASLLCLSVVLVGVSAAQGTNFSVGPQYLMTSGSPLFAGPIATPSLSLEAPLPGIPKLPEIGPEVQAQPYLVNPELRHQANLFPVYYGYQMISVVELSSSELPRELPASITDVGVVGMTTAESLRERGYGVPIGYAASFWKARTPHAKRVYTNADIERLHQN